MTWRQRKKIFYGLVFAGIIAVFLFGVYSVLKPKPNCSDKKQNQKEEGIDCGGPCISCEVFSLSQLKTYPARYLIYKDNSMDLIAEIANPNTDYGIKKFDYKFTIIGTNGETREATGKSFILSSERKYILAINKKAPNFEIASVSFKTDFPKENWQKTEDENKEVKIDLLNYEFVKNQTDNLVKSINAEIINSGNTEYLDLVLKFIVFDSSEKIIATGISEISKIEPLERQTINITLPALSGIPDKIIFEAESNIFQ